MVKPPLRSVGSESSGWVIWESGGRGNVSWMSGLDPLCPFPPESGGWVAVWELPCPFPPVSGGWVAISGWDGLAGGLEVLGNALGGMRGKTASPDQEQGGDKENDQILAVHIVFSFFYRAVQTTVTTRSLFKFNRWKRCRFYCEVAQRKPATIAGIVRHSFHSYGMTAGSLHHYHQLMSKLPPRMTRSSPVAGPCGLTTRVVWSPWG